MGGGVSHRCKWQNQDLTPVWLTLVLLSCVSSSTSLRWKQEMA